MSTKDEKRRDWIKVFCMVGALIVSICALFVSKKAENTSIRAENISKNVETAISKLTIISGPAGINQSGGSGSFNIGDMRIGAGQSQPSQIAGLEGAKTALSNLGNRELADKTMALVGEIRNLANTLDKNWQTNTPFSDEFLNATNQAEKERAWVASGNRSQKFWAETKFEYHNRFKVDAILLRDELRSRLPKTQYANDQLYDDPSLSDFYSIADDLEKLAKLLPQ